MENKKQTVTLIVKNEFGDSSNTRKFENVDKFCQIGSFYVIVQGKTTTNILTRRVLEIITVKN